MNRSTATLAATGLAALLATGSALTASADASQATPPSGLGWSAVIHHKLYPTSVTSTLRMVGPTGSNITIGSVDYSEQIEDVSLDGAHVITSMQTPGAPLRTRLMFWNTKTRTATQLMLGGEWKADYISGGGILTVDTSRGLAYKRDSSGKAVQRFYIPVGTDPSWVNPEGTRWVMTYGNRFVIRSATTGDLLRTLTGPEGKSCGMSSQENSTSFLASCQMRYGLGGERTYSFSYTGAASPKPVAAYGVASVTSTTPRVASDTSTRLWQRPVKAVTLNTVADLPSGQMFGRVIGGYGTTAWILRRPDTDGPAAYTKVSTTTTFRSVLAAGSKDTDVSDAQVIDGHH